MKSFSVRLNITKPITNVTIANTAEYAKRGKLILSIPKKIYLNASMIEESGLISKIQRYLSGIIDEG